MARCSLGRGNVKTDVDPTRPVIKVAGMSATQIVKNHIWRSLAISHFLPAITPSKKHQRKAVRLHSCAQL
jgi:hypothetical protein